MSRLQLSIRIEKPFIRLVNKRLMRRAVELTLACAGINYLAELSLVIADDDTVHELNRTYRGVDRTTDVIAFALSQQTCREAEPFVIPPDAVIHLGEVIISYPQARRQAEEQHHSIECELALLVAHGVLHLVGYDHKRPKDREKMRALEAEALSLIESKE